MKAVFAHDHKFIYSSGEYYSNGSFGLQVFERYKKVFGDLTILSRQKKVSMVDESLTLSSDGEIIFVEVPNLNTVNYFTTKKKANRIISNQIKEADILIARLPSAIGSLAIKHAKKNNKPYIVEVVACSWDSLNNHGSKLAKLVAPFKYLKQKEDVRNSPYTIYITKSFLQSRYPTLGKSIIAPNVLIPSTSEVVLTERYEKIKRQSTPIKFGLIGSLDVDYKGHKTLLEALSIIKDSLPSFKVEFLGQGDSERWIELAKDLDLEDNLIILGSLPSGDKVFEWMDTVDIAVQPSLAEAQGRSIIEFMSRGCPVIATKVGGIVELLDDNFLVEPSDYEALSKKILKMLNKEIMLEQSIRNFSNAEEYYSTIIEKRRQDFFKAVEKETVNLNK